MKLDKNNIENQCTDRCDIPAVTQQLYWLCFSNDELRLAALRYAKIKKKKEKPGAGGQTDDWCWSSLRWFEQTAAESLNSADSDTLISAAGCSAPSSVAYSTDECVFY